MKERFEGGLAANNVRVSPETPAPQSVADYNPHHPSRSRPPKPRSQKLSSFRQLESGADDSGPLSYSISTSTVSSDDALCPASGTLVTFCFPSGYRFACTLRALLRRHGLQGAFSTDFSALSSLFPKELQDFGR
jgi:hypothetical protein